MKSGKTIVELAVELQNLATKKRDIVLDTREMSLSAESGGLSLMANDNIYGIEELAHKQIATRVGIPARYYDRMRNANPTLLANNVNTWFKAEPKRHMVRTLEGKARAVLSDRYRRIDNEQIAEAVLPALLESSNEFEILSSEITESKMYIQARLPRLEGEVKVGDAVQAGVIITNSEVGLGAIDIKPMIYRLICTNGMVAGTTVDEGRMRRTHLGSQVATDDSGIIFENDTMVANDKALMLQIRDSIKQLSDPGLFAKLLDNMTKSAESEKIINPIRAVEELGKAYTLPKQEQDSILERLIGDHDYTKWGMLNAVTNIANTTDSYDRAVELEQLGGNILTLSDSDWHVLAIAA